MLFISKRQGALWSCIVAALTSPLALSQTVGDAVTEEIIVRAHPLSAEGLSQPVAVLSGEALENALSTSLGATLMGISGVHSASFGEAVGRPVIRGLGGPRVKTMEDRIDTLDVSVSSPDHATTVDPFIAESIEVLKGPSTLLYGSGAIGGVVDVHTGRIPHNLPEEISGKVEARGADNADRRVAAGRVDGGVGSFAFHFDGFYRDADDYDIPGFAESARYRAQEAMEEDEEHDAHDDHEEEAEAFGVLPGSSMQTRGGALGLSWVGEHSFAGLSVSSMQAEYGLPGHSHHHHDEEHGEQHDEDHGEHGDEDDHADDEDGDETPPMLDLEQTRVDLEAGFEAPFTGVRSINFRLGYNDYEHIEVEGDEGGTTFASEAYESRFEIRHEPVLGFDGVLGIQASDREFSAVGEEAFIQPVDTQTVGLFWVGQRQLGDLGLEMGVRVEKVDHDPVDARSRSFSLGSASLGVIHSLSDNWTLSGAVDYSNRAPVAEELYSFGPHLATQTFEIGDNDLLKETAANLSVNLDYQSELLGFSASVYGTEFSDFIYEANTGLEEDELPVLIWSQGDASFQGVELDLTWQAMSWRTGGLALNGGFDYVRARLDQGSDRDLPRIPPQRWRLQGTLDWMDFQAVLSWMSASAQTDVAANELPTDSFDDLRVRLSYAGVLRGSEFEIFLSGRNLTDDEQRFHASFIGNLAPQPGRTVEVGLRLAF